MDIQKELTSQSKPKQKVQSYCAINVCSQIILCSHSN